MSSMQKMETLTASIPSPVNALTRVLEVQLNTLVNEACIAGHDHCPSCMTGGHAGHIKALFPLLVDPLERKAVRHLHKHFANRSSYATWHRIQSAYKEGWAR